MPNRKRQTVPSDALVKHRIRVMFNPKSKYEILLHLLRHKGLPGKIYYDAKRHSWMYDWNNQPQRLGTTGQAIITIMGGTMDFIAEHHAKAK